MDVRGQRLFREEASEEQSVSVAPLTRPGSQTLIGKLSWCERPDDLAEGGQLQGNMRM